MQQEKLWNRDFILASCVRIFSSSIFNTFIALIALFTMDILGYSEAIAGAAVGSFIVSSTVARIIAGRYIEIIGRRKMLIGACVALFVSSIFYLIPLGIVWLFITRIINGMAFGVVSNTVATVTVAFIPRSRLGEGLGFVSLATTLGSAVGPFIGIYLYHEVSYIAMFAMCCVFAGMCLLLCSMLHIKEIEVPKNPDQDQKKGFKISNFIEIAALPICLIIFLSDIFYTGASSFVTTYAETLGIAAAAAWYFVVYSVVVVIIRPSTGRLFDRKGDKVIMYPAFLLYVIAFLLMANCTASWQLLLASGLFAAGRGSIFSTTQSLAIRDAAEERVGVATSTFWVFADGGAGVGPMVAGFLAPLLGFSGLYTASAVAIILLTVYYAVVRHFYRANRQ